MELFLDKANSHKLRALRTLKVIPKLHSQQLKKRIVERHRSKRESTKYVLIGHQDEGVF